MVQNQFHKFGQNINYIAAWRRQNQIKQEFYGNKAEFFQKISLKFLAGLKNNERNENFGAWTKLELERNSHQF